MAEDNPPKRGQGNPDPDIAAADWLFQEGPPPKPPVQAPGPVAPAAPGSSDFFALADGHSAHELATTPGADTSATWGRAWPTQSRGDRVADSLTLEPAALVEEVWTRRAEWGSTLFLVGVWLAVVLWGVYFAFQFELYEIGFVTLLFGTVAAVILCYPIFITLERPVRMTPEQAVRDYYGALAHHIPHFRRMWLLLSTMGRISTAYGSPEGFKAYWKSRLSQLRKGHASSITPLVFEVADFRADKSAGKVRIDAEYTLKIWVRGQRKAGLIHAIPMRIVLVRGPDRMWYLEDGTLGPDRG